MGENTKIQWANHTFNPWWGCTEVGGDPACGPEPGKPGGRCYARALAERVGFSEKGSKFPIWGQSAERRFFGDGHWTEPFGWNIQAQLNGEPARVFCGSMCDWAEGRRDQAESRQRLWQLIHSTDWLTWMMLTKRPQLINELCPVTLPRVWQGTTVATQKWMDIRVPHLLAAYSNVYFLSCEPMMERLRIPEAFLRLGVRGWVICGGQSGPGAVKMDLDWARSLRDQCLDRGVRFFMKQASGTTKAQLEAIPADLMIRQFPIPARFTPAVNIEVRVQE